MGPRQALRDLQKYRSALRQSERDALDAYYGGSSVPPNPQHLRSARRKIATWSSRDLFISCVLTDAEFDGRLVLRRINGLGSDRTIPEIERLVELQSQFAKLLRTDSFTVNDRMAAVLPADLAKDAATVRAATLTFYGALSASQTMEVLVATVTQAQAFTDAAIRSYPLWACSMSGFTLASAAIRAASALALASAESTGPSNAPTASSASVTNLVPAQISAVDEAGIDGTT